MNPTLYFLHYNNAFNRLVKKEDTLEDYQPYVLGYLQNVINWNPNDGVSTKQIINWSNDIPDYMIVVDENGDIDSRWFVIEATRTRAMQLELTLQRDLAVDYYDSIMNSTCFIEKGYVNNSDPLIFNNENMGFNQIKQSLTLLSNNLKTPWIVLYLSRYHTSDNGNTYEYNTFTGEFIDEADQNNADYELDSLEDYKYYYYSQDAVKAGTGKQYQYAQDNDIIFHSYVQKQSSSGSGYLWSHNDIKNDGVKTSYGGSSSSVTYPIWTGNGWTPVGTMTLEESIAAWNRLMTYYRQGDTVDSHGLPINSYSGLGSQAGATTLTQESGKTIKVGNKVYRIVVNTQSEYESWHSKTVGTATALGTNIVKECFTNFGVDTSGRTLNLGIEWDYYSYWTTIEFEDTGIASNGISYNFTYKGAVTTDSVYEIIATPYNDVSFVSDGAPFQHSGRIALQWFQDIINRYNAAGWAYDIQLVPYLHQQYDTTNITNLDKIYCYSGELPDRINHAVGFRLPSASFTLDYDLTLPSLNSNNKISNETQLYRLVSPNGVGEYEFSPSKNGGFTGFEVDCTLIPFNPYIKVNPRFGWLYGTDLNEFRGLILGGDYSLPILNNSWSTYQLNNKFYQQIFDRNIASEEFNNKWALVGDIVGASSGALGGAAAGAAAGSMVAPGPGTIAGAIGGFALSGAGGVADIFINKAIREQEISRKKDVFGMELGTIKARAQSLTRGNIYNINNKYFPYIEYYTCTDKELEALENKIKYTGMTIGVIGKIEDYIDYSSEWSYIQAQLIHIDINDDTNTAEAINQLLKGGIRIA